MRTPWVWLPISATPIRVCDGPMNFGKRLRYPIARLRAKLRNSGLSQYPGSLINLCDRQLAIKPSVAVTLHPEGDAFIFALRPTVSGCELIGGSGL